MSQTTERPGSHTHGAPDTSIVRQMVTFTYYKVDPAWRRLPEKEREKQKQEAIWALEQDKRQGLIVLTYSTVGMRPDCDFLVWRVATSLEPLQKAQSDFLKTALGGYLTTPYSYLSMTKRSMYVDKHAHPGSESTRTKIVPGNAKYLFVYPFWKTVDWYLLNKEVRQKMMDVHIAIGHKYPSVKINTTYSFGLDDQEFVVAFESDKPEDFLDCVMDLRESEMRKFTLRDTPIFTCVQKTPREMLDILG
jgi:chlorite dismutase